MHQEDPPAKVASNAVLGLATERACFERWYEAQKDGKLMPWDVWQAARADAVADGHACIFAIDNGGALYRRHKAPQCVSVEAVMDTRTALGICALQESDFPELYALQGHRVRLVDLGPNV